MKIVVVRHFPTLWNSEGLLQGKRDESILPIENKNAHKLKKSLSKFLDEKIPDIVLASSLVRSQQTATILGYDDFQIDPRLDELDFGCYEGCKREKFIKAHKEQWNNAPASLTLGEPIANLKLRIDDFLLKYKDRTLIVCFGHGAWMRALCSNISNDGDINYMNQLSIPNLGVLSIDIRQGSNPVVILNKLEI